MASRDAPEPPVPRPTNAPPFPHSVAHSPQDHVPYTTHHCAGRTVRSRRRRATRWRWISRPRRASLPTASTPPLLSPQRGPQSIGPCAVQPTTVLAGRRGRGGAGRRDGGGVHAQGVLLPPIAPTPAPPSQNPTTNPHATPSPPPPAHSTEPHTSHALTPLGSFALGRISTQTGCGRQSRT